MFKRAISKKSTLQLTKVISLVIQDEGIIPYKLLVLLITTSWQSFSPRVMFRNYRILVQCVKLYSLSGFLANAFESSQGYQNRLGVWEKSALACKHGGQKDKQTRNSFLQVAK